VTVSNVSAHNPNTPIDNRRKATDGKHPFPFVGFVSGLPKRSPPETTLLSVLSVGYPHVLANGVSFLDCTTAQMYNCTEEGGAKVRAIHVQIEDDLYIWLKTQAAEERKAMRELISEAVSKLREERSRMDRGTKA
jgi:hypothetical protein